MEEVDKIIIESLKHLHCDIDDFIVNLKQFDSDTVVSAISTCLEAINPHIKLPKKLPPSMSARIKFASSLAQQIKEFGFKGDMGYQTILYSNEVEVRRVLMYLLERIPKEPSSIASVEPMGYVSRIVKQIEDSLKNSLSQMWLPAEVLISGLRASKQGVFVNSCGASYPMESTPLCIPDDKTSPEYEIYIPFIAQQCRSKQLVPSLLFQKSSAVFPINERWKQSASSVSVTASTATNALMEQIAESSPKSDGSGSTSLADKETQELENNQNKIQDLLVTIKEKKDNLLRLQDTVSECEEQLVKLKHHREQQENYLQEAIAKAEVKRKTLAILSNEENKTKLKNLIQKTEKRFSDLVEQWNEVKTPLLEEHKTLKSSLSTEGLKYHNEQNKLRNTKKLYKEMVADYKQKCALEENLIERCKELNNKNSRTIYTIRILEIVGNTKKQNKEIQKILADTRQVQKDIKNLTGQVDRSFTLCDEIIFHDCKHDESARRAYKYLAALREECNGILKAVSDMGQSERELRNLAEQIETEKNKNINEKLGKVQKDLAEIKKEIELLV